MAAHTRQIKFHITFEEENSNVRIKEVKATGPQGHDHNVDHTPGPGPQGTSLGELVTFPGSTCISLNIGGGFYKFCF
jgi:hypothetical protein